VTGRPRILAPLLAAGMVALSLERLEFLHWIAALALFVILALFIVGTEVRKAKQSGAEANGEDR
jgi:hypothetical protein